MPDMFRQIIRGAKDFLQEVIFKFKLPPRPMPKIDLQEWKDMQKIMYELQGQSREIKRTQQDISSLKKQLSELRGFFTVSYTHLLRHGTVRSVAFCTAEL